MLSDGGLGFLGVEVSGEDQGFIRELAQGSIQALVHLLGVAPGQIHPPATPQEERIPGDELRGLSRLLNQEALGTRRMPRRV